MKYFLQSKKRKQVLTEHNLVCLAPVLDLNLEKLRWELKGKADIIEVYSYDSLNDTNTIKLCFTVNLKD